MKIIRKQYWQDIKNVVEQISIIFGNFSLIKLNLFQTLFRQAHQNTGKNTGENSYISRYSKGQISTNNIGEPIYRSVSS